MVTFTWGGSAFNPIIRGTKRLVGPLSLPLPLPLTKQVQVHIPSRWNDCSSLTGQFTPSTSTSTLTHGWRHPLSGGHRSHRKQLRPPQGRQPHIRHLRTRHPTHPFRLLESHTDPYQCQNRRPDLSPSHRTVSRPRRTVGASGWICTVSVQGPSSEYARRAQSTCRGLPREEEQA